MKPSNHVALVAATAHLMPFELEARNAAQQFVLTVPRQQELYADYAHFTSTMRPPQPKGRAPFAKFIHPRKRIPK